MVQGIEQGGWSLWVGGGVSKRMAGGVEGKEFPKALDTRELRGSASFLSALFFSIVHSLHTMPIVYITYLLNVCPYMGT